MANWQIAGGDRLGHAVQAQLDLGDDAERALGADVEPGEVVAGARFARAAAGADDPAVGRDDGEPEHVLAHRAVANGVGARRARRGHAADRRVGAGIDREEQARALELGVELLAQHARLHAAVEVLGVDLEHAVHLRQVDAHAAVERGDVALERRADAERDDRHARRVAKPDDRRDLVVRVREHDDVRQPGVGQALAVAVLVADRARREGALAVVGGEARDEVGDVARVGPHEVEVGGSAHGLSGRSEPRQFGVRKLAVVHVHLAELGAAGERRDALAGIEQRVRVERGLDAEEALELGRPELHAHLRQLLDADAVLAGDRAADLDAQLEDRGAERLGALRSRRRRWRRT